MSPYTISKSTSLRIYNLSFVLICMVVFIHSQYYQPLPSGNAPERQLRILTFLQLVISEGVCRVAVPLFFLISGMLFFRDYMHTKSWYYKKIISRTRTLLMPYLLWNTLNFIVFFIAQVLPYTKKFFDDNLIMEMTFIKIFTILLWKPYCGQFWFVRDLYIYVLFAALLSIVIRRIPRVLFPLLIALWLMSISMSLEGLLFFCVGAAISIYNWKLPETFSIFKISTLCILWISFVVCRAILSTFFGTDASLIHHISIILGIPAIWFIIDKINPLMRLRGSHDILQYTFFVFAFHLPMILVFNKLLMTITGNNEQLRIVQYLSLPIIVICLCIITGAFLKTYVPMLYSILTGNRTSRSPVNVGKSYEEV